MRRASIILRACLALALAMALGSGTALADSSNSYGPSVDAFCSANGGTTPFADNGCSLCHTSPPARNTLGAAWRSSGRDASVFCPQPEPMCNDYDGDDYGNPGDLSCANGSARDCNDNDPSINPGAEELCDGVDNDCDGVTDEGCPTPCPDLDGDGFSPDRGACGAFDCNDDNSEINPDATEVCDGIDNDCDGATDEGGVCEPVCVPSTEVCDGIDNDCDGRADQGGVCEPVCVPTTEVCDGVDNDCDGQADEGGVCTPAPEPTPTPAPGSGDDDDDDDEARTDRRDHDDRRSDGDRRWRRSRR